MTITYISYWGLEDGLTRSTVWPNLRVLLERPDVDRIHLFTIERGEVPGDGPPIDGVEWHPLPSEGGRGLLRQKWDDFTRFPRHIARTPCDLIIARGAPTGGLAWLVHRRTGTPFVVESFEPHAGYMLDGGTWGRWDPRTLVQRIFERAARRHARALITVSENFRRHLIDAVGRLDETNVLTAPCTVDATTFAREDAARRAVRDRLGVSPDDVVGIYVGKFGDIYYDAESYEIFARAAHHYGARFFLVVLTPGDRDHVIRRCVDAGLDRDRLFVDRVPHDQVAGFLSAADIAFCPVRPSAHRIYCSPIKTGEYWAAGLPVLIPADIGDDSRILRETGLGAVIPDLKPASLDAAFRHLDDLLAQPGVHTRIADLAAHHRHPDRVRGAYAHILDRL